MGSDHKKHKKEKKKKRHRKEEEEGSGLDVPPEPPKIQNIGLPQSNKDEKFVWKKKHAQDGLDKLDETDRELIAKMKEQEKKVELWKVQRRREERELEQAGRAEEVDRVRLEKEREMFKEWQEQEGDFHLEQARLRSELRIKNNRANPIDLLAHYIHHAHDSTDTEIIGEPISVVQNISLQDLEDLQADIKVYKELDRTETDLMFWNDLEIVCVHQAKQHNNKLKVEKSRSSINSAVGIDVERIFKGKTSSQLSEMHKGIQSKLEKGGPIDVSYWENVAQQAFVEISKARLKEKHEEILKRREFAIKTKAAAAGQGTAALFPIVEDNTPKEEACKSSDISGGTEETFKKPKKVKKEVSKKKDEVSKKKEGVSKKEHNMKIVVKDNKDELCVQEYEDMCYTPIRVDTIEMDALVYTDQKIHREIQELRGQVIATKGTSSANSETDSTRNLNMEEQAQALMGDATEDEELFNTDFQLDKQSYDWSDRYKPRKPRFYNRVHTGYEWNKYNQTHYDQDNPPPKIVQGYKFNIFYQDLIDTSCTPQYKLTICPADKDFCILKISAGPPYEEIAFKVLNKEWEYSNRYSFKSQFSQGIFQLWFQFKKYRYRR